MQLRRFLTLLVVSVFVASTAANAAIHRVKPGESIQEAIDGASSGDTILVWPGVYEETGNATYGLRITQDNLRLIGRVKPWKGEAGKVKLLHTGTQETGIYAAPDGCEYRDSACASELQGFYVRGFSVEGFPQNGIQTRWVDGFKFIKNESINNLNNGIYPTLSANGLVAANVSYGSTDTSMWVAGSQHVRVIGNEVFGSPIGYEITVSNDVYSAFNYVHDNTVGLGLFHPNAAGNPPLPVMADWVFKYNYIENNNVVNEDLPNPAPPTSFQAGVPAGVGVLMLGISDHEISRNLIRGNEFVGVALLGWCTGTSLGDPSRNCFNDPPITDSSANNNLISENVLIDNGTTATPPVPLPAVDLLYLDLFDGSSGNCFRDNFPADATFVSSEPGGELPTDGC